MKTWFSLTALILSLALTGCFGSPDGRTASRKQAIEPVPLKLDGGTVKKGLDMKDIQNGDLQTVVKTDLQRAKENDLSRAVAPSPYVPAKARF